VAGDAWPSVSIVFLAYNRRDELAHSLGQVLEHLDYPVGRLEVIVVDNASSDGTAGMVRECFPGVRLLANARNEGASAWNAGMLAARGRWRMILDDDCFIDGDALKTAVAAAEEHDADLVSFRVRSGLAPGFCFNDHYQTGLLTFWGCAAMFSARAIEAEPFYDPNIFIWANEMELTMRLLDRGFRHLHLTEVTAVHMTEPKVALGLRGFALNTRHFAYIAAKLMRPRDAAGALGNLALHVLGAALAGDVGKRAALREIPPGVRAGLRARAPVRPEVSRVYRRHTWHFASPLPQAGAILRPARAGDGAPALRGQSRWFAQRSRFYPAATAVLEL
jgi:GT2 family glycosyltransferase